MNIVNITAFLGPRFAAALEAVIFTMFIGIAIARNRNLAGLGNVARVSLFSLARNLEA